MPKIAPKKTYGFVVGDGETELWYLQMLNTDTLFGTLSDGNQNYKKIIFSDRGHFYSVVLGSRFSAAVGQASSALGGLARAIFPYANGTIISIISPTGRRTGERFPCRRPGY